MPWSEDLPRLGGGRGRTGAGSKNILTMFPASVVRRKPPWSMQSSSRPELICIQPISTHAWFVHEKDTQRSDETRYNERGNGGGRVGRHRSETPPQLQAFMTCNPVRSDSTVMVHFCSKCSEAVHQGPDVCCRKPSEVQSPRKEIMNPYHIITLN